MATASTRGKHVLAGVAVFTALACRKHVWAAALAALASLGPAQAGVTVLYAFKGGSDGDTPSAVIEDSAGYLNGTTCDGGYNDYGTVFRIAPDGSKTIHYSFDGFDGACPLAGLIADKAGNLYGTTFEGGSTGCEGYGCGTVFKLTPNGEHTVLHTFTGEDGDGSYPQAALIEDEAGNLYGTTNGGGADFGTVFEITAGGSETVLYAFKFGHDGAYPQASLLRDRAGNLYGTTPEGGENYRCMGYWGSGCGTVFKITPNGAEKTLYAFRDRRRKGVSPLAGLIKDRAGNFYGTTVIGGSGCLKPVCGTVFELASDGSEKDLYDFRGQEHNDGADPNDGVIRDKAGKLYGTTYNDGANGNFGTIFELAPDGTETVLYSFAGGKDGRWPEAGLIRDKAGNFYGSTSAGGGATACQDGCGTVFRLTK